MQLILSIYHVICSVTSKINIKNSAKFNIRSTSRLTYDIISQLHLPQNGYFMEHSNFLVAIIKLILRSLAIIPADSSAYAMRLLHSFLSWRYGAQEMIFHLRAVKINIALVLRQPLLVTAIRRAMKRNKPVKHHPENLASTNLSG